MKEHIYTIPVIEGFNQKGECPFCNMFNTLNKNSVDYMLGPSYMEDDIRMDTNKIGFCKKHYAEMYNEKNRLGLALMLHTHMQKLNTDLESLTRTDVITEDGSKNRFRDIIGTKRSSKAQAIAGITGYIKKIEDSCYICDKINRSLEQFVDTFFYLWKTDKHIIDFLRESNGFCIFHFAMLLDRGESKLNPKDFQSFLDIAVPKQLESLKRVESDVDWFIKKFDYKYADEPWKNSKDAVSRALLKVSSISCDDN